MFTADIRVSFSDADPAGIMFFANAYRFAHQAYEAMMENFSDPADYFFSEKFAVPILHSESDYLRPVFPNTIIRIEITVREIRQSSFELDYLIRNKKGEECVKIRTVHVVVDKKDWRKIDIPDQLREFLRNHKI